MKVIIIGSREPSIESYDSLVKSFEKTIPEGTDCLVSGGSSWCDFVAFTIAKKYGFRLEIYLPSNLTSKGFVSTHGDRNAWKH